MTKSLRLVIDDKIPFMHGFAERLGEVRYLPGAAITAADVHDADALIVRTRTRCDRALLEGSSVKYIATATIGYDHIDTNYLQQAGIAWANCPGCNARSVAQYVESALLQLAAHGCWDKSCPPLNAQLPITEGTLDRSIFSRLTLGIVGVGHVGTEVWHMAQRLGFRQIVLCDPPRAEREGAAFASTALSEVARTCDIVTFHTPLTRAPHPHATFHMADEAFFEQLRPSCVVVNTSRGEVVCNDALREALASNRLRAAVVDTWESEPGIDRRLLDLAFLATPHIAGYSADGKANGTRMSLQHVARFFGLNASQFDAVEAPSLPAGFEYDETLRNGRFVPELRLYDPSRDSRNLKSAPETFEALRGNYPLRRETDLK